MRITAQLIDTHDGTHLWSETCDRDLGDVLKMQDEIAAALVQALKISIDADTLRSRPTLKNLEAYNLYLRGVYANDRFDEDGLNEALNYFRRALELDPTFAAAAAALSTVYYQQGEWALVAPGIAFVKARQAAEAALKLDPNLAIAHSILGAVYASYDWDWAAAERENQRALALAPNDEFALWFAARLLMVTGRYDAALAQMEAGLAQNPVGPYFYQGLNWIQTRRGKLREAEAASRRALEIDPTYSSARYYQGLVLLARGEREAALASMQQETPEGGQLSGLAIAYYALGRKANSDEALTRAIKEQSEDSAFSIAEVYAFRGELDEALRWLDRAYAQKDSGLIYIKGDLPLKNLENDARFKAFLKKMNLPE